MKIHSPMPVEVPVEMEDEAIRAWRDLFSVTPRNIRDAVSEALKEGAETLTEEFYERMQNNQRAGAFLDQERVQRRLRASLRRWMTELFGTLEEADIPAAIRRQIEIGMVHARIRVPIDLIPAGIRVLKRGMRRRIDFIALDPAERLQALIYVSDLLHLADSLMNQAYLRDAQDVVRNDEAYRVITQKRSATVERARQRAALSEWAEGILLAVWGPQSPAGLTRLRDAEFGVWMHHKGATMFDGSEDFRTIVDAIETMDNSLLPRLQEAAQDRQKLDQTIGAIKNVLDLIRYKINDLFESSSGKDDGLDHETQLPGRHYLPAVLVREMRAHGASGHAFCLALIEVDFPALKSAHSAGTRSRLLQVAVNTIVDSVRTTDHVFRFDEHRFLLIAVESGRTKTAELAQTISEKLRHTLQAGNVQGSWTTVKPGVFAGVAEFDRHPDYQYFIQRAETALAEAVSSGRSRIAFG